MPELVTARCSVSSIGVFPFRDDLIAEYVVPDPQSVPGDLIDRIGALPPDQVLAAPFLDVLRTVRAARLPRVHGMPLLLRTLRNSSPELERSLAGAGVAAQRAFSARDRRQGAPSWRARRTTARSGPILRSWCTR